MILSAGVSDLERLERQLGGIISRNSILRCFFVRFCTFTIGATTLRNTTICVSVWVIVFEIERALELLLHVLMTLGEEVIHREELVRFGL